MVSAKSSHLRIIRSQILLQELIRNIKSLPMIGKQQQFCLKSIKSAKYLSNGLLIC